MPASKDRVQELEMKRSDLKTRIAATGDMRPGSLVQRYRRCGKPNCNCAKPGAPAHGPSWSLTKAVDGKTVTRVIPAGPAAEQTKSQVDEHRRFRGLVRELVEVSEQLCDARLAQGDATSQEAAKKGGSQTPSRKRSPPRSKHS